MTDRDFDALLRDTMRDLPPEDMPEPVNPWGHAMTLLIGGLVLTSITVRFFNLDLFLPALGWILMTAAFRSLRRENRWFRACWILSGVRALYQGALLILAATIWYGRICESAPMQVVFWAMMTAQMVMLFCLWRGLRAVRQKAGLEPGAGSALALLLWNLAILVLAWLEVDGVVLVIGMLVIYICILLSIRTLSGTLDEAGYLVKNAPVRMSERALIFGFAAVVAVGMVGGNLLFHSYPMDWQPEAGTEHAQVEAVKTHLRALNFPEDVLRDLTDEEILGMEGAKRVVSGSEDHPMNEGREVVDRTNGIHVSRVYDVQELRITGVAVELPGEREQWQIIHHFQWMVDPKFYGTETIQLWPAWHLAEGWVQGKAPAGRVLCERKGQTCWAPYYALEERTFRQGTMFSGSERRTDLFADFSMPRSARNHRGYVTYSVYEGQEGGIIDSWMNYTHQTGPFQYPCRTAREQRMTDVFNLSGPFVTGQTAVQFFPSREDDGLHGLENSENS